MLVRRGVLGVVAAVALAAAAAPARAQEPPPGLMSDDIEHLANIDLGSWGNGGRLVGKHFYYTTGDDLTIFDVSDPEAPSVVGTFDFPAGDLPAEGPAELGYQEDVDTNGKLLVRKLGPLVVVDVSDPAAPKEIGRLENAPGQHTITCLLECTWAYGSEGAIYDLRDPTKPAEVGNWKDEVATGSTHDLTEVAPGILLVASNTMVLMDARNDPLRPVEIARSDAPGFVHGTLWPNRMLDPFALAGGEAGGPVCDNDESATFHTWDTRGWEQTKTFRLIDEFRMSVDPASGKPGVGQYCTHWFDAHPAFGGGGLVAIGWYEQGTRLLRIDGEGKIEEVGWFLPYGGSSWAAYWITDRILYVVDHHRGIDILRWTGEIPLPTLPPLVTPPPDPGTSTPAETPAALSFDDLARLPSARRCVTRRSLAVRVKRHRADPVTRLRLRVNGRRPITVRGKRLARPVRLRALPRKRFALQVEVTTRSGHRTAAQRRYRPCGR